MIIDRKDDPKIGDRRTVKRFWGSLFGIPANVYEYKNGKKFLKRKIWVWFDSYLSHEKFNKRLRATKSGPMTFADWDVVNYEYKEK